MRRCLPLAVMMMATLASGAVTRVAWAQPNQSLAGAWSLTEEPGGRGGRGGVPGVPIATELVFKISPAEVQIDSNTGSARTVQAFVYKLDGTQTSVPGPLGWETKGKARWDGGRLVVTNTRSIEGPNGPVGVDIVDTYEVAGDVLTLERSQGRNRQKLVYKRKS